MLYVLLTDEGVIAIARVWYVSQRATYVCVIRIWITLSQLALIKTKQN